MRTLSLLAVLLLVAGCDSSSGVAEVGDEVLVVYEGRFEDGKVFNPETRTTFTLNDNVIPGFRDGIVGMAIGETRTFSVPPEQGYGSEDRLDRDGNVVIPANSTLIFEVTLLDIR